MPDRAWKAYERRCCRDMAIERIPVTGERGGADGRTSRFCLQFKLRRSLPAWLWRWLAGICGTAQREQRIGVLVLKVPRMRDDESLVVLRWADWLSITEGPGSKS